MKSMDIPFFLIALMMIAVGNIFGAIRWAQIMIIIGAQKSRYFSNALGTFCIGQIAGIVVPSRVGNYSKVPLIKSMDDIPYEQGLAAVNAETILDLIYIACAGILSFFILSAFLASYPGVSGILIGIIFLFIVGTIILIYNHHHLQEIFELLTSMSLDAGRSWFCRAPAYILSKILLLIQSTRGIFSNPVKVIELSVCTVITQLFGVLGLFFILQSVHTSLPPLHVFAILSIVYILGIASFIPGGFGVSDLSLIALLGYEGVSFTVATNVAILWRIVMYLPVIVFIGLYFLHKRQKNDTLPEHSNDNPPLV
jgi:uncharacterized protein (TIRG00374 family)